MPLSDRAILDYISEHRGARRGEILRNAAPESSETTVWRSLKRLVAANKLEVHGKGPATRYNLAGQDAVRAHLKTPYNRRPPVSYKRSFVDAYMPGKTFYLRADDRRRLRNAGTPAAGPLPAGTHAQRMFERVLVDLSWASSRMEGNTYNILETKRLIRFGEEAAGKDRKEAVMILNHKEAIQYVVENLPAISIRRTDICNIHALLADGLLIDPGMAGRLRRMPAAIGHSSYQPLDDQYEIAEEFRILVEKAAMIGDPFEQSFFLLAHIPYLQAFDDINKRTSRIASNLPLLKSGLAPMSFVTMDDKSYMDGLFGIYELNNVSLLRDAYIGAYVASARNYHSLRAEVDTPEKAALTYREFVREAIRRSVLEWKGFQPESIVRMADDAGVPEAERNDLIEYIRREFRGLHEGNAIRYRLSPEDLAAIDRE